MLMSLAYVEHPVYQNGFFTSLRIQYLDFVHIVIDFGILKTLQSLKKFHLRRPTLVFSAHVFTHSYQIQCIYTFKIFFRYNLKNLTQ